MRFNGEKSMNRADVVRERLLTNLDQLVEDVEELVNATGERSDDGVIASVRRRISQTLASAKNTLEQANRIFDASRQGAEAVVSYTRDHCWTRVAMKAGAVMALACVARSRWRKCQLQSQEA
jgi:ElaB/YqjD/DUF883 family membrane-anchored ribosome-binding protein